MKYFMAVLISIFVLSALVAIYFLIYKIRAVTRADNLLKSGRRNKNFIYNLIATHYSVKNILQNVYFHGVNYNDYGIYKGADIILILKGGIYIFNVNPMGGVIHNPIKGDWVQIFNDQSVTFQNPFEENIFHIKILKDILRREKIPNIPVHNAAVFSNSKVKFRFREDMLLTSNTILNFIHDQNKNRFLKSKEISKVIKIIKKYQIKNFQERYHNV